MHLEEYLDFIEPDVIRIKGHRVGLEHLLRYYQEGYSPEQIALEFPGMRLEKIYGAIAYYLHNKAEVDAYLARVERLAEQAYQAYRAQPAPPVVQRIRAIKQHLEQDPAHDDDLPPDMAAVVKRLRASSTHRDEQIDEEEHQAEEHAQVRQYTRQLRTKLPV